MYHLAHESVLAKTVTVISRMNSICPLLNFKHKVRFFGMLKSGKIVLSKIMQLSIVK